LSKRKVRKEKDSLGFRRPTIGSIPKPAKPFGRFASSLLRLAFNGIFAQWVPRLQTQRHLKGTPLLSLCGRQRKKKRNNLKKSAFIKRIFNYITIQSPAHQNIIYLIFEASG
jgi:hypothetical protein